MSARLEEVYEYLVGSPAFKAGVRGDPSQAGSIPVHLRQPIPETTWVSAETWVSVETWASVET